MTLGVGVGATGVQLSARAAEITQGADGIVGFSVACGRPPRTISSNADRVLRGASTLKIGIVLADAITRQASGGDVAADQYARSAVVDSDNSAANALLARAGDGSPARGVEATNALFRALGMERTRLDGPYVNTTARSQKVTTASDLRVLAEDLQRLAYDGSGPLAANGATQDQARSLIELMSASTYPSVFATSGGAEVAHKSGWLDDAQNDLAIITLPGRDGCAAGFVSEGLSLAQAQQVGSRLMREVVRPLAAVPSQGTVPRATTSQQGAVETQTTAAGTATVPPAGAPQTTGTAAAGTGSDDDARPRATWLGDWWVWALAGLVGALVLIAARQRQLDRRRRARAGHRRRSR